MISLPPTGTEPKPQRVHPESVQAQAAAAMTGGEQDAHEARRVAASPLVPDLEALSAGREHPTHKEPSFDVSAESLGELLARNNMNGASVAATQIADSARRVRIASLGPDADPSSRGLVAHLRITGGRVPVVDLPQQESPVERRGDQEVAAEQEATVERATGALVDIVG